MAVHHGGEDSKLSGGATSSPRRRVSRYAPLLIWLAIIFFASTDAMAASNTSLIIGPLFRWLFPRITEPQLDFIHFVVRKLAHFTEYGVLALLAARAFLPSSITLLRRAWYAAAFCLVAVYALLDEYHQSFVPTRTASIRDSFIDMAGGATALLLFALWRARRRRRERATAER